MLATNSEDRDDQSTCHTFHFHVLIVKVFIPSLNRRRINITRLIQQPWISVKSVTVINEVRRRKTELQERVFFVCY